MEPRKVRSAVGLTGSSKRPRDPLECANAAVFNQSRGWLIRFRRVVKVVDASQSPASLINLWCHGWKPVDCYMLRKMSLDLRTGRPVWLIGRQRIAGHRKLAKNIRSEVAVVGGGVSGALIAHRPVSLEKQVITVDSRDVGMGSTMASTAILSYEPDVHLIDLIAQIGQRPAVRAYRAGIEALDSLEQTIKTLDDSCDFRRRESIYLASNRSMPRIVRRECATRQKHNFKVELLTRRELAKSYSLRAPCAILTRQAAEVNPLKLTLALIRSAQRKGLKVFSHTAVKSYRPG